MTTLVGTQNNLIDAIKALLELEYDSIELYEAVINRLQNEEYKTKIVSFKKDHLDHIEKIIELLDSSGVEYTKGPDGTQVIAIGKAIIGKLTGGDISLLKAMIPAEEDNITAYDRMLKYDDLSYKCVEIFKKGLMDETKHREWILSVVEED